MAAPMPLSIFTTASPGAQLLEHAGKGGKAPDGDAVANTGRKRDNRLRHQPRDDRGQRAFHAGNDDEHRAGIEFRKHGQQPMEPCHTHVSNRQTWWPKNAKQTAASSATGMSLVPAQITPTTPRPRLTEPAPAPAPPPWRRRDTYLAPEVPAPPWPCRRPPGWPAPLSHRTSRAFMMRRDLLGALALAVDDFRTPDPPLAVRDRAGRCCQLARWRPRKLPGRLLDTDELASREASPVAQRRLLGLTRQLIHQSSSMSRPLPAGARFA